MHFDMMFRKKVNFSSKSRDIENPIFYLRFCIKIGSIFLGLDHSQGGNIRVLVICNNFYAESEVKNGIFDE